MLGKEVSVSTSISNLANVSRFIHTYHLAVPAHRARSDTLEDALSQHLPGDVNKTSRVVAFFAILALASKCLAEERQDVPMGREGVVRGGRGVVLRQVYAHGLQRGVTLDR